MQEREVNVGILKTNKLKVVFHGEFLLYGEPFVSEHVGAAQLEDEQVVSAPIGGKSVGTSPIKGEYEFTLKNAGSVFVPSSADCSFTLKDVVIGIDFHWERKEDQTFKGALKLIEEDGMLRAVNVVPVETYLTSVISSEMSANASLELLKAHAVISRSWLLRQMEHKIKDPGDRGIENEDVVVRWYDSEAHVLFDVCADDHCQRYQGITRQSNQKVVEAIDMTRGEVLMSQGEVCDARFSKCCGGVMETFENCWEEEPKPYLVGKEDIVMGDVVRNHGVVDAYCNTKDARILSQVLNNYDQETVNFYRWTVRYSTDELSELVKRRSGIDFGTILDIVPVMRGVSDRIVLLKIVGSKRTITVGKELEIRKWLSESHLYSSAFDVEKTAEGFVLRGKGWGHGVGLCQIGAAVMGDKGFNYKEILEHYYPNSSIEKLW